MASSASLRCCGDDRIVLDRRFHGVQIPHNRSARSCSLPRKTTISASVSFSAAETWGAIERRSGGGGEAVAREKLDEWMRESVVDIVKNLRAGPLMVHVYGRGRRDGAAVEVEKAAEERDWLAAVGRWEAGESPVPEGMIFVDELRERHCEDENDSEEGKNDSEEGKNDDEIDGVTRAWGVVIQGRGSECPPACYLLKTSTTRGGSGSGCGFGLGCTHFCLVRVNGFRETTESQLKNCWLLQAQTQFRAQGP